MKYAITAIISSAYYMNLFLKPVPIYYNHSWTQLLEKLFKVAMPMGHKYIVNRYHIILLSVIFLLLALKPSIDMLDTMLLRLMLGSIAWHLTIKGRDGFSLRMGAGLMLILIRRFMLGSLWVVWGLKLLEA